MAATIALAFGRSRGGMETKASRLGSGQAEAQANTRTTFTTCKVNADGSGSIQIERVGFEGKRVLIQRSEFGPYDAIDNRTVRVSGDGYMTGGNEFSRPAHWPAEEVSGA